MFLKYFINCLKPSDPETDTRRKKLKSFAIRDFKNEDRCEILATITEFGIELVKDYSNPTQTLIADLKSVLIGRNMTICRGKGKYFAGNIEGSVGFKEELRDPWNQVQHATAGIVIAFQYGWLGEFFVKWLEKEPQDDKLYDVTYPLGRELNDKNYLELPQKIRIAIGE